MSKPTLSAEHSAESTPAKILAQDKRHEKMADRVQAGDFDHLFPKRAARIKELADATKMAVAEPIEMKEALSPAPSHVTKTHIKFEFDGEGNIVGLIKTEE